MSATFRDVPATTPVVVIDDARPRPSARSGRAASLLDPPPPGGGLAIETSLPSGDPLSTHARVEEGPWGVVLWGGDPFPAHLLPDSDLKR